MKLGVCNGNAVIMHITRIREYPRKTKHVVKPETKEFEAGNVIRIKYDMRDLDRQENERIKSYVDTYQPTLDTDNDPRILEMFSPSSQLKIHHGFRRFLEP